MLRKVLLFALLYPSVSYAGAIFDEVEGVTAWVNDYGTFVRSTGGFGGQGSSGVSSYANSLYTFSANEWSFPEWNGTLFDVSAIILPTGTSQGEVVAGVMSVRSDADGVPERGVAGDKTLLVANAIDAWAGTSHWGVLMLFEVVYRDPLFFDVPGYLTLFDPRDVQSVWGKEPINAYLPWQREYAQPENRGWTSWGVRGYAKVGEPSSLFLLMGGLGAILAASRRRGPSSPQCSAQTERNRCDRCARSTFPPCRRRTTLSS